MAIRAGSTRPASASHRAQATKSSTSATPQRPFSALPVAAAVARGAAVVDVGDAEAARRSSTARPGPAPVRRPPSARRARAPSAAAARRPRPRGPGWSAGRPARAPRRCRCPVLGGEHHVLGPGEPRRVQPEVPRRPQHRGADPPSTGTRTTTGSLSGPPARQTTSVPSRGQRRERRPRQLQLPHPPARGPARRAGRHRPGRTRRPPGRRPGARSGSARTPTAGRRSRCPGRPPARRLPARPPAVQRPHVGAVGEEPQRAVGAPHRLHHRLDGLPAGHRPPDLAAVGRPDHERAASHGMSGWSHRSHASDPSGPQRGSETKSEPLTSTSTVPSAATRTTALRTSAAVPAAGGSPARPAPRRRRPDRSA